MLKSVLLFILFFPVTFSAMAQSTQTVSGHITDSETGETLIGATVLVKDHPGKGTASNSYGFYSLTLPEGRFVLRFSYVGYQQADVTIDLSQASRKLSVSLKPESVSLSEVVVTAERRNQQVLSTDMGLAHLEMKEVKKIPVLLGEQDMLKTLQLTPGVKSLGEGNGGMYVRGGDGSQNLILLDEAVVYNASHLLGFFSTFNSDAVKDMTLYKGTAPADFGGRLASVLDVKMNDGNNRQFKAGGGLGLISARLNLEGPIVKEKGSFLISGRRTYGDLIYSLVDNSDNSLYFYDLNLKANYQITDEDRIFLSGYFGRDVVGFENRFGIDWGNRTGTLRWNRVWTGSLFSNTSLVYSDFDYQVETRSGGDDFRITSVIKNLSVKQDFHYFINTENTLRFGFQSTHHTITPGQVDLLSDETTSLIRLQKKRALEHAWFATMTWKPDLFFIVDYGLRLSGFVLTGPGDFYTYSASGAVTDTTRYSDGEPVKHYLVAEPRVNMTWVLDETQSVKASYTRNSQNLHLVTNSTSSSPTDIWLPSSNRIKPEISDQISVGYFRNFAADTYEFSTESYYKWMQNQVDLKNGAEIRANDKIEGELLFGQGRAWGTEFFLKKRTGKLTGWIGYTWSVTEKKIEGISNGNWYPAKQDISHDLAIVGMYEFSETWTFSALWVYNTGNAATFPSGKYLTGESVRFFYTERNGYRMPDYHRLDLGATWQLSKTETYDHNLTFSLYNAYGRKNAYTIDFEVDPDNPEKTRAVKTYLFTFTPSITYNFRF